jgi:hypothetical protein
METSLKTGASTPIIAGHSPGVTAGEPTWVNVALVHRLSFFFIWQAVIAVAYAMSGQPRAWQTSAAWWPMTAFLTSALTLVFLQVAGRREGLSYRKIIGPSPSRTTLGKDLLAFLGISVACGPVAMLPNFGLATLLFGNIETAMKLFVQPLPRGVAFAALFLFPISVGLSELPVYYAYAMPRLSARWSNPTLALLVTAFWHSVQHATLPFLPDVRFVLWRLGMFFPFALFMGLVIRWRPRLLPYLMVGHALIDFMMALMVWQAAIG